MGEDHHIILFNCNSNMGRVMQETDENMNGCQGLERFNIEQII